MEQISTPSSSLNNQPTYQISGMRKNPIIPKGKTSLSMMLRKSHSMNSHDVTTRTRSSTSTEALKNRSISSKKRGYRSLFNYDVDFPKVNGKGKMKYGGTKFDIDRIVPVFEVEDDEEVSLYGVLKAI